MGITDMITQDDFAQYCFIHFFPLLLKEMNRGNKINDNSNLDFRV